MQMNDQAADDQAADEQATGEQATGEQATGEQATMDQAVAAGGASAPGTGDLRVDAALRLLDRLPELPVGEHAPVFERVHAELTEILGDLDPESAGTSG
jgi:hypothetical protein